MNDDLVGSIKSRGYWRVNFRPMVIPAERLRLARCQEVVERNSVSLRGWDYPHIPRRAGDDTGIDRLDDCVQAWIEWETHREFWRMYTSSQFLHYIALREDWRDVSSWSRPTGQPDGPALGILGNAFTVVEVFEFAARLTRDGLYADGASVTVELHNTQGRQLYVDDSGRAPLSSTKMTQLSTIPFERSLTAVELAEPKPVAAEAISYIFERFGWDVNAVLVQSMISQLYERGHQ